MNAATTAPRSLTVKDTEDAVVVILALATETIAAGNHPGHTLHQVFDRITSDEVLCLVREFYGRRIAKGETPRDAVIGVGQSLIAHYCEKAGIPTAE
jgi:hypothetical protein